MNAINLITEDNILVGDIEFKYTLYYYLLANASSNEDGMFSNYHRVDIYGKFASVAEEYIDEAFDELEKMKLIVCESGSIWIGEGSKRGTFKLYSGVSEESAEKEKDLLISKLQKYERSVKGHRAKVISLKIETLNTMFEKPFTKWTDKDFVIVFTSCYEAVYQETHRELVGKDYGQMKNFARLYSPIISFRMIVHYITEAEMYSKSLPTIGSLVFLKDEIYTNVSGITAKKREKIEEDF